MVHGNQPITFGQLTDGGKYDTEIRPTEQFRGYRDEHGERFTERACN